jgi:hypothetical protein
MPRCFLCPVFYGRSCVEGYRGISWAKNAYLPQKSLENPPKVPPSEMGQVRGMSQGRSYLSYHEDTPGTPQKFEFKATPARRGREGGVDVGQNVCTRSWVESYRGISGAKNAFSPKKSPENPPKVPPLSSGAFQGLSQCCSYLSYHNNTPGTP